MKFHVIDASLTEFYLTNDDILHYNLAINISVRNSNKIERISYDNFRSEIYSYGEYLGSVSLPSFWQNTKNTTLLHPVFQGQTLVKLRGSRLRDFNYDQRDGNYSISVYLYVETELKHAGGGKSGFNGMEVECGLFRLHLLGSSSSSSSNQTGIGSLFKTKRCKVYYDNDDSYY
ncbi:putative syntaxin-24 [Papaver somniferum]|uniref:putative syntaxin-24 n=1 Tax=Papaver somniferum TaxID=3469 RepID=UPI000E6FE239|nr:putative syntaxin-24 [Papaver somniferum]